MTDFLRRKVRWDIQHSQIAIRMSYFGLDCSRSSDFVFLGKFEKRAKNFRAKRADTEKMPDEKKRTETQGNMMKKHRLDSI